MNKLNTVRTLIVAIGFMLLYGCQADDQRIRGIFKEEFSKMMERSVVTDVNVIGPYIPAQKVGNFLFTSGQIAINQQTGQLDNQDIETETGRVLENLMMILRKAGFDSSDVVSTIVYLKDMNNYSKMNMIYGGYFQDGNYPARTTVQVAALPRDANIEISAIAYKSK
jgi:2-iminobutanoate/2-iminopropanoate deaminase